jgi:hypothetical protein
VHRRQRGAGRGDGDQRGRLLVTHSNAMEWNA